MMNSVNYTTTTETSKVRESQTAVLQDLRPLVLGRHGHLDSWVIPAMQHSVVAFAPYPLLQAPHLPLRATRFFKCLFSTVCNTIRRSRSR
jgi:hypothetical protein